MINDKKTVMDTLSNTHVSAVAAVAFSEIWRGGQDAMTTLEQALKSYQYGLEHFYPGDGEAHLINAQRRYLGEHIQALTAAQIQAMRAADALVAKALRQCKAQGSWEQDNLIDLQEYLSQTREQAA